MPVSSSGGWARCGSSCACGQQRQRGAHCGSSCEKRRSVVANTQLPLLAGDASQQPPVRRSACAAGQAAIYATWTQCRWEAAALTAPTQRRRLDACTPHADAAHIAVRLRWLLVIQSKNKAHTHQLTSLASLHPHPPLLMSNLPAAARCCPLGDNLKQTSSSAPPPTAWLPRWHRPPACPRAPHKHTKPSRPGPHSTSFTPAPSPACALPCCTRWPSGSSPATFSPPAGPEKVVS